MEIPVDEITEGAVLLDYGTVDSVVRETLLSEKVELTTITVGRDEITFTSYEYVRIAS